MMFPPIVYRFWQFWQTLWSSPPTPEQLAAAKTLLTDSQMKLFSQMQASEQNHSLRVLREIQHLGETDQDLLVAALLHDVGKIRYPLRLWERVFVVLGKTFFSRQAEVWGKDKPKGWTRPFVVAAQHALWGAELALEAGTTPRAAQLIRRHQDKRIQPPADQLEDYLLSVLQNADNLH